MEWNEFAEIVEKERYRFEYRGYGGSLISRGVVKSIADEDGIMVIRLRGSTEHVRVNKKFSPLNAVGAKLHFEVQSVGYGPFTPTP